MPAHVIELPAPKTSRLAQADGADRDWRYRRLLGEPAWRRLPASVQERFSRRLDPRVQTVYRGEVVITELSVVGWLLAQAARMLGGPLPYARDTHGPSTVIVTDEPALGGQVWTRCYARSGRFPQVIQSAKRFQGPTGLEEDLGLGLLMRLAVSEDDGTLVFTSTGYALSPLGRTIPLPRWLSPGRCEVRHRAETDARFSFTLTLDHPLLGRLLRQVAFYQDETQSRHG
jgi:hypothetical protein